MTARDVRKAIRNLRPEAPPGPDGITPRFLRELEEAVTPPLVEIFNKSLKTGEVPRDWRTANVTPIYKGKGVKTDPGNYRPVSLTSVPGKILETILKEKLMNHLNEEELIRPSQHGFMPGRSCTTNLVTYMDKVTKEVDEGRAVDIIYLDFAKAFNKVPKARLMTKMKAKGIGGDVHRWIENWLTGREQRVVVGGESSGWKPVTFGVPQGSVLGPSLFTVQVDDLEVEVEKENLGVLITKFADDTKGMRVVETEEDRDKLQRAIDLLCKWAENWGMSFNTKKCKVMHVGRKNKRYEYNMNGQRLETKIGRASCRERV